MVWADALAMSRLMRPRTCGTSPLSLTLLQALQQLDVETFHAGAHVFEDWAMDEDAYMHAAPQRFCEEDVEEEKAHYTKSIAAGMLGCTTSHFLAWASFAQQGLSPYDSADCVSTVTPLRLLG